MGDIILSIFAIIFGQAVEKYEMHGGKKQGYRIPPAIESPLDRAYRLNGFKGNKFMDYQIGRDGEYHYVPFKGKIYK